MRTYSCEFCENSFTRLQDYMVHYHTEHLGRVDLRRTVSCWSCAGQVHTDDDSCPWCGWVRTPAHIHGTQHIKEESK